MADFTPTQGRYLAFIRAYTRLHGYPPAESEIAAAMCVSPPSVNQMVKMLEKKGLILRRPGEPRSIAVLIPEDEIPPWNIGKRPFDPDGPNYGVPSPEPKKKGHGDARTTKLDDLNLKPERAFGYRFDFGDDWYHQVQVDRIEQAIPTVTYPRVIRRVGKSPPQYRDE
jgi:hypothetical protein